MHSPKLALINIFCANTTTYPFSSTTQFYGNVGFAKTCFEGIAEFSEIVFPKVANFEGCHFGKKESQCLVDFSNAIFKEGAYFSRSHFFGNTNFKEARFLRYSKELKKSKNKEKSFFVKMLNI